MGGSVIRGLDFDNSKVSGPHEEHVLRRANIEFPRINGKKTIHINSLARNSASAICGHEWHE